ncbi:PLP-dependent aminotransferase family protein [Pelagicoccus sp. SDUM812003]|uniref:aminotransferase-like domain-containing protein n=1 Tax=Pelagicoccus sp. SDUM812003 TaxID=3041267 RepID=UPI0028102E6E|nr:PLP-dependent aminotransferase family protein [Pelagicoccus sp. SDUM812003]MDQ8205424.1 PLP-dependent aminotransferase family protein [Pelagicoccus sp. SDUM812003]
MSLAFSQLGSRQVESDIARLMTMAIERPELLSLAAGFTDNDTLPLEEVTKVAVELGEEGNRSVLQYGANQGRLELRQQIVSRLERQDGRMPGAYSAENCLVTNGSQQSLYLAVQTLCDPGDVVLVEQPTYFVFLEMLRGLGVEAVPMPMGSDGDVDVEGLRQQLAGFADKGELARVKAVYLVSYFANPSGHSVSSDCKDAIVSLLAEHGGSIAIFEDAAYRELYYKQPFEAESCIQKANAEQVPLLYTSTLTKPFASGLKVGYAICTHRDWLNRMLAVKGQQDFGTVNYAQAILCRVFEKGLFDQRLETLRQSYHEKMLCLHQTLLQGLGPHGWAWEEPRGGLYIWVNAPSGIETDFDSVFHAHATQAGVMYVPGDLCDANRKRSNKIRLSFGVLQKADLEEAARRFIRAAEATQRALKSKTYIN